MYPGSLKGLRFKAFLIIILGLVSVTYAAAVPLSSPKSVMPRTSPASIEAARPEQETMGVKFIGKDKDGNIVDKDGKIVAEELVPTLKLAIEKTLRKLANDPNMAVKISGDCVVAWGSIRFTLTKASAAGYDEGQILFLQKSLKYQIRLYSSKDPISLSHYQTFKVRKDLAQFIPKSAKKKVTKKNAKLPPGQSSSGSLAP
ncbi:hypothetical protein F5050DRAFT_1733971 [Lentinula boryana]|uniref:Uncharacterized protein n=1 Tax=Lentinula boryana TaxID=40481 RepID=A0ABQ8QMV9_9AGAR|nr:hypothetical protein F5050DRAFT_1733971 [Lentinula boryana]